MTMRPAPTGARGRWGCFTPRRRRVAERLGGGRVPPHGPLSARRPSLVEDDLGGRRWREDAGVVRQVAVAAAQVDGVADQAPAARDVAGARVLEVGVRGVCDAVPGAVAPGNLQPAVAGGDIGKE